MQRLGELTARLQACQHPLERTSLLQVRQCAAPTMKCTSPYSHACPWPPQHARSRVVGPAHRAFTQKRQKSRYDAGRGAQELTTQSTYHGIEFWGELFEDHQGSELWQPLAEACLRELHALCECTMQCALAVKTAAACAPLLLTHPPLNAQSS